MTKVHVLLMPRFEDVEKEESYQNSLDFMGSRPTLPSTELSPQMRRFTC
jgi:hypothetical protein